MKLRNYINKICPLHITHKKCLLLEGNLRACKTCKQKFICLTNASSSQCNADCAYWDNDDRACLIIMTKIPLIERKGLLNESY